MKEQFSPRASVQSLPLESLFRGRGCIPRKWLPTWSCLAWRGGNGIFLGCCQDAMRSKGNEKDRKEDDWIREMRVKEHLAGCGV